MDRDREFERNSLLFLFFLGIVLLTIGGISYYLMLQSTVKANGDVEQTYQTIRAADQSQLAIDEAAMDVGRFLNTTDLGQMSNLPELIISAQINLKALDQWIQGDENEQRMMAELKPMFNKKIDFLNKVVTQFTSGDKAGAMQTAADPERIKLTQQINQKIIDIKHIEVLQLEDLKLNYQKNLQTSILIFISFGIICEFLFLISYIVLRHHLKKCP